MKLSTVLYLIGTIVFGLAAASLGKEFPLVDVGLAFTGAGLTVGSAGK